MGSSSEHIRQRLADEVGRIDKQAPFTVALAYPSPYAAAMSSLGYQRIYRAIMEAPGMAGERAFLDDAAEGELVKQSRPLTYESRRAARRASRHGVQRGVRRSSSRAWSDAEAAGIPPLREERDERHPFILAGGPLTFSNPLPLAPFCDAIIMGEAEALVVDVLRASRDPRVDRRRSTRSRTSRTSSCRRTTARLPGVAKVRRRAPPGVGADPHARRGAVGHVPPRDGARLLARLHVLRDAPLDQRRHARRADGTILGSSRRTRGASASSARRSAITRSIVQIVNTLADEARGRASPPCGPTG